MRAIIFIIAVLAITGCLPKLDQPVLIHKMTDKESEETPGLPGYAVRCEVLAEETETKPERVVGCYIGDEKNRNEAISVDQIQWTILTDNTAITTSVVPATNSLKWHAFIYFRSEDRQILTTALEHSRIVAAVDQGEATVPQTTITEKIITEPDQLQFQLVAANELSGCAEGYQIVGEELIQTEFYQDYLAPKTLGEDSWIWVKIGNSTDIFGTILPLTLPISTELAVELRSDGAYRRDASPIDQNKQEELIQAKHWLACASQEFYQELLDTYLIMIGGSGHPFCSENVYGRLFDCNGYTCGKSDPGYKNICQVPDDKINRAPSGYPYCEETFYGRQFSCGQHLCAKSDPEYKHICQIKEPS